MLNPVSSIIRQVTRKVNEPLHILCGCAHERYETGLAKTGHTFYAIRKVNQIKDWNTSYGNIPSNYILLDCTDKEFHLPNHIQFDLVLSHNKFSQFQTLYPVSRQINIPLISLEHTAAVQEWPESLIQARRNMRGDINVFITRYSINSWRWEEKDNTLIIHHMIDADLFKPNKDIIKKPYILSVVNDWKNRDYFCGFYLWARITQSLKDSSLNLPVRVVGDNSGLSQPAGSIDDLVKEYQTAQVFLNTSLVSPIPMSLLEAASCGCGIVSTATCAIPEFFTDGINAFISNDETVLRDRLKLLLSNPDLAYKLGQNARKMVLEKCSQSRFLLQWNDVFQKALNIRY